MAAAPPATPPVTRLSVLRPANVQHLSFPMARADARLWQARKWPTARSRGVFVRAGDAQAQRTLARLGIEAPLGVWHPASLSGAALEAALTGPNSLQLRSAPSHRPMSTQSLTDIGALQVHAGSGVSMARRGDGVLMGFIDTGIDLTHPAFLRPDGSSRVVAFWDQDDTSGSSPVAFGYGRECSESEIHKNLCPLSDPTGHGTHVAAIAAGSGAFEGVAPAVDLAVVSSSDFTRLADAVTYLSQLADTRNQALVVNISVGGQYGPHDGRTPLEVFLGNMVKPGRLLVAAAGNDGKEPIHIGTTLSDEPVRVEMQGLPVGRPIQTLVELWGDAGADVRVTAEVWVRGSRVAEVSLDAADNQMAVGTLIYGGNSLAEVSFAHDQTDDNNLRRHLVTFDRSAAAGLPKGGVFALRLTGHGVVQGWISQSDYGSGASTFGAATAPGWLAGDGQRSIAVPATAPRIIAVGSYTVQTSWESEDDGPQTLPDLTLGALSSFSSVGPSGFPDMTGLKPDLCAPGSVIASARAAAVPVSIETLGPRSMVMQGTSMAAPHVAGTLALMLEANPLLGPDEAREILRSSARGDDNTGSTPNAMWGYGKLDTLAAVHAAEQGGSGCTAIAPAWAAILAIAALWKFLPRPVPAKVPVRPRQSRSKR